MNGWIGWIMDRWNGSMDGSMDRQWKNESMDEWRNGSLDEWSDG